MNADSERRRLLAAVGLCFGPSLYAVGECMHHQLPSLPLTAAGVSLLGLYVWIPGILGLVHLLRPDADRLGLLGGAAALLGLLAVSNIMVIQLVFALIDQKVETYPDLIRDIFQQVLFVTYLFGPVFPAALAVLAGGLLWRRVRTGWAVTAFLVGSLTFPLGRVGGVPWLIHATDLILAVGGVGLGWDLWRHPNRWYDAAGSEG